MIFLLTFQTFLDFLPKRNKPMGKQHRKTFPGKVAVSYRTYPQPHTGTVPVFEKVQPRPQELLSFTKILVSLACWPFSCALLFDFRVLKAGKAAVSKALVSSQLELGELARLKAVPAVCVQHISIVLDCRTSMQPLLHLQQQSKQGKITYSD